MCQLQTCMASAQKKTAPNAWDEVDIRRRLLPPYNVILHNDDHNPIPHVVKALQKSVPGMSFGRATATMWEAHTSGKAIVITCHLELAELYQQRLRSFGLTATPFCSYDLNPLSSTFMS